MLSDDGPSSAASMEELEPPLTPRRAAWFDAVKGGDLERVRLLLAEGAHLDACGEEVRCERGGTGLMWAAAQGHLDVARELMSCGSDLECRCTRAGGTALIWAASRNQTEAVALLLAHGAYPGRSARRPRGGHGRAWNIEARHATRRAATRARACRMSWKDAQARRAARI